jgi:dextranase
MMRGRIAALLGVLFLVFAGGKAYMQVNAAVDIVPNKAFFRPRETATFRITASGGERAEAAISHLAATVAVLDVPVRDGAAALAWTPPPDAPRGYGITVRLLDGDRTLATASTAFDVLERWTQAPRYGFLSEFAPGRDDAEAAMDGLLRFHVNGLQFYDWQYRHESLLPPDDPYTDPLGRRMSLATVERLIDAAHARGIAAMPYTAIYGASPAFYRQHPEWALLQATGKPFEFADGFLIIMDPSPGSPWNAHLLGEFARVLDETAFDGIHIDQYGAPQIAKNAAGERVDLAGVFPAFIDQTAALVRDERGEAGAVIFNAVRNWPIDTVAPSDQDAVYIEVWDPYRDFMDLHRLVVRAQDLGGGKPVILAAYIHPDHRHNVRLANAVIFASGGTHLELGEPGAMLADPYFPKFGVMDADVQATTRRYYDFLVRYGDVLATGTTDATGARGDALLIDGVRTRSLRSRDRVAVIVRQGRDFETFSLVNLLGLDSGEWARPLAGGPDPLDDVALRIYTDRPVANLWWASPDGDDLGAVPVGHVAGRDENGPYVALRLPRLDYWTMIVLEYES